MEFIKFLYTCTKENPHKDLFATKHTAGEFKLMKWFSLKSPWSWGYTTECVHCGIKLHRWRNKKPLTTKLYYLLYKILLMDLDKNNVTVWWKLRFWFKYSEFRRGYLEFVR